MLNSLFRLLTHPEPLRSVAFRRLFTRWKIGDYNMRVRYGAVDRPWYGWCLLYAALQAKSLGYPGITAIEFGVAGGNGLVCLCDHADEVKRVTGIDVKVYGMDRGEGLPPTGDWRDRLYAWPAGSFKMDRERLSERIGSRAQLIIGDVAVTVSGLRPPPEAPLGAVLFDLDLYTSTRAALQILQVRNRLPRVWCYFDDVVSHPWAAAHEQAGELAAIDEYNRNGGRLSPANCFRGLRVELWHSQVYVEHRIEHPEYNKCLALRPHELPLT